MYVLSCEYISKGQVVVLQTGFCHRIFSRKYIFKGVKCLYKISGKCIWINKVLIFKKFLNRFEITFNLCKKLLKTLKIVILP